MRNGTIYHTPTEESVTAAKLVLEGADVAGESLYFLAPTLTNNHWIMENRDYTDHRRPLVLQMIRFLPPARRSAPPDR